MEPPNQEMSPPWTGHIKDTTLVLSNHWPVLDMLGSGYEAHNQDPGTGCTHQ